MSIVPADRQPALPEIGKEAPNFSMPTDNGAVVTLSMLRGTRVVVYFYPKDDTPGCTTEGQDFSANKEEFDALNTHLYGVSKDSIESHNKFKKKYDFTHTLLMDLEGEVCDAYGVWVEKNMYGKRYMGVERATFLVDEKGILRNIWRKVKVKGHVASVLEAVQSLDAGS